MPTQSSDMTESDIPGRPPAIDKAKYLSGRQCAKLLWHAAHARHLIPEAPANQRAIFEQAREVGALARQRFPDGLDAGSDAASREERVRLTREALAIAASVTTR